MALTFPEKLAAWRAKRTQVQTLKRQFELAQQEFVTLRGALERALAELVDAENQLDTDP